MSSLRSRASPRLARQEPAQLAPPGLGLGDSAQLRLLGLEKGRWDLAQQEPRDQSLENPGNFPVFIQPPRPPVPVRNRYQALSGSDVDENHEVEPPPPAVPKGIQHQTSRRTSMMPKGILKKLYRHGTECADCMCFEDVEKEMGDHQYSEE